jgi:hypothetical protein
LILKDILANASQEFNRKIIVFRYREKAWEWITSVAIAKPRFVSLKTAHDGPVAGLIPVDPERLLPEGCSTTQYLSNNIVLTYKNCVVTSDLDILSIERKENENVIYDEKLGYLTKKEKEIIEYINYSFKKKIKNQTDLITHGPYINHINPKLSEVIYPYDGFHPTLGHTVLNNFNCLIAFEPQLKIVKKWPAK